MSGENGGTFFFRDICKDSWETGGEVEQSMNYFSRFQGLLRVLVGAFFFLPTFFHYNFQVLKSIFD